MIRKLTATSLATLALAGVAGTGAAFAAASHSTKPVSELRETPSKDSVSPDRTSADSHVDGSADSVSADR
jgi:hypothetical protein